MGLDLSDAWTTARSSSPLLRPLLVQNPNTEVVLTAGVKRWSKILEVMKIVSQLQELEELEMRAETSPELMQFAMRIGT
ncbi:hypothetical protein C4D60_Mb04t10310 [Musa balbisiana]|uniref:Uncharacterized protein n=1 Tax=Musa balbisiana TaxID=52838 RepID=A0A4S8KB51_MUSBA|nr:hypothetical protein C4D60_Mb04t10310 [Musa balbisiana]